MNDSIPKEVYYTTRDGAKRLVRFRSGAVRRIQERFGMELGPAISQFGLGIVPEVLYLCMYDRKGEPPGDVDLNELTEDSTPEELRSMLATLLSAYHEGIEKNELEAHLHRVTQEQTERAMKLIGLDYGRSADSASDSQTRNSGGSPQENSTHSSTAGETTSEPGTPASA